MSEEQMYAKPDKTGFVPNQRLSWIGTKWLHYKRNSAVYIVVGFSWDGVTDLWNVLLQRDGDPAFFNRMIADFTDVVKTSEEKTGYKFAHRFRPVFEYESPTVSVERCGHRQNNVGPECTKPKGHTEDCVFDSEFKKWHLSPIDSKRLGTGSCRWKLNNLHYCVLELGHNGDHQLEHETRCSFGWEKERCIKHKDHPGECLLLTEHGCKQHPLQPSALCELCESNRRYLQGVGRAGIIEE